jgi:hypothetical protein
MINNAQSGEQVLANITSDIDSNLYQIAVSSNDLDSNLETFQLNKIASSKVISSTTIKVEIFQKKGLAFETPGHIKALDISSDNFDIEQGGVIVIDTIFNLLTGKRKKYEFDLAKDKTGWKFFYKGKPVSEIYVEKNVVPILGVVGAKNLIIK